MRRLLTRVYGTRVAELAPGDVCRLHRGGPLVTVDDIRPSKGGPGHVVLDVVWPSRDGHPQAAQAGFSRPVDSRVYDHRRALRLWTVALLHADAGRDLTVWATSGKEAVDVTRAHVAQCEPNPAAVIVGHPRPYRRERARG